MNSRKLLKELRKDPSFDKHDKGRFTPKTIIIHSTVPPGTLVFGEGCREIFLPSNSFLDQTGIILGGFSRIKGNYVVDRPASFFNQMIYTYEGSGETVENNRKIEIRRNSLFITKASKKQSYKLKDKFWNFLWFWINDTPDWKIIKNQETVRPAKFNNQIKWVFDQLVIESSKISDNSITIIQMLSDLLLQYLREELHTITDPYQVEITDKINTLVRKVYSNIEYPWNLKKLSEESELYLSTSHFMRVFHNTIGITPMKMVTKIRMEIAANLLKNTDYTLNVIAIKTGYSTPYVLSATFKKWFGISPREYKKGCDLPTNSHNVIT